MTRGCSDAPVSSIIDAIHARPALQAVKDTPFSFAAFAAFVVVVVSYEVLKVCMRHGMSNEQPWLVLLSCWLCLSAYSWLLENPNQDRSFVAAMMSWPAFASAGAFFCFISDTISGTGMVDVPPAHAFDWLIAALTLRACCEALSNRFAPASSAPQCGRAAQKYYHIC